MKRFDEERAMEIIKNGSIETVMEKVKETPVYGMFKSSVRGGKSSDETEKLLMMMTMLLAMGDEELSLLMASVANNMLFSALNMRLRSELGQVD